MAPRPSSKERKLSLFENLYLVPAYAAVLSNVLFTALTAKLVSKNSRPSSFTRLLSYASLRTLLSWHTARTEQAYAPGTEEVYAQWCKEADVQPVAESLGDGSKAYWVGSKGAQTVLLYFHGGGYVLPANPVHLQFLHSLVTDLSPATPGGFAVLLLHYDVAPYATYPRQLAQAAALLNHARTTLELPDSSLLIGGDSAGGNLSLDLLSHTLHPHPDASVPKLDRPFEQLKGALLISPWTSFDTNAGSFKRNATKDFLPSASLNRWSSLFLDGKPTDPYNQPADAPPGWWTGIGSVVKDVIYFAGGDEILLDDMIKCEERMKNEWKGEGRIDMMVIEGEAHVSCWSDLAIGFKKEDIKMYSAITGWLKSKF